MGRVCVQTTSLDTLAGQSCVAQVTVFLPANHCFVLFATDRMLQYIFVVDAFSYHFNIC